MTAQPVSLATLAGGAAIERFDREFERVIENIADPNTTLKKRTITLTISIKPDERRENCEIDIGCISKLAAMRSYGTHVFVDPHHVGRAFEADPHQMAMEFEDAEKPELGKTIPLKKVQNDK